MLAEGDCDEGGNVEKEGNREEDRDEEAALAFDEEGAALEEAICGGEILGGIVLDVAPGHLEREGDAEGEADDERGCAR